MVDLWDDAASFVFSVVVKPDKVQLFHTFAGAARWESGKPRRKVTTPLQSLIIIYFLFPFTVLTLALLWHLKMQTKAPEALSVVTSPVRQDILSDSRSEKG